MSKLTYITSTSLDGYVEDERGAIDWGNPEHVFGFITELVRPMRTFLCGRRLYETMAYWNAAVEDYPPEQRDFARVWQALDKVVFSRTLTGARAQNLRIARDFDVAAIRKLKRTSDQNIGIGGAQLAGLALEADLLDECHLFVNPVILGGGKPPFPTALRRSLELLDTRRFQTGVLHLHYRIRGGTP
jgi:dihydrofolate reductase